MCKLFIFYDLKKTLKAIKKKPSLSRVWCLVNDAAALAL